MGSSSEVEVEVEVEVVVVVAAECGCCGMWEECTAGYVGEIKEKFAGVWVCGLCAEAIKGEQEKLGVGVETAMRMLASFREKMAAAAAATDAAVPVAHSVVRLMKKMINPNSSSSM